MAKKSIRLILNGKKAGLPQVRKAVHTIRGEGHLVDVRSTWEQGCAARYAAEALEQDVDVIVAGGGDGTVNEVVNGILNANPKPEIPMAVMPIGSANDFARGCGIPHKSLTAALRLAATGKSHTIDVGRMDYREAKKPKESTFFINSAIIGFGAEVTFQTPESLKKVISGAAYGITGFLTALKQKTYTGKFKWEDGVGEYKTIFAAVSNGIQAGGFQVAPQAKLNDGLLDVFEVPDFKLDQLAAVIDDIAGLKKGREPKIIHYDQAEWLDVEADRYIPVSPDGEELRLEKFHAEVVKGCLPIILPDGPLLQ